MDSKLFYKAMSGFYDLIDIVYFRDYENSPRKVVLESIGNEERVLDLCTGTATNALKIAKSKPFKSFIEKDLYCYFERYGLKVVSEVHCDYSRVLNLKRSEYWVKKIKFTRKNV